MDSIESYLPPWLLEFLPSQYPLVTLGLTLLALFLWLRIPFLLLEIFRRQPADSEVSPPPLPISAGQSRRDCIWGQDRSARRRRRTRWICATCGAQAFTQDGRPPKDCKRGLGPAPH